MKRFLPLIILLSASLTVLAQVPDTINITDSRGKKQGYWIKRDDDGKVLYEGRFIDDNPVGEFRRYYPDGRLRSLMVHSGGSPEVFVKFFHPNGFIAAEGLYINQKKEGNWKFFSKNSSEYLICEELYRNDLRNGPSVKYYKDGIIAEKLNYTDDIRTGEWTQYYVTGKLCIKAAYVKGLLEGPFEVFYPNGQHEFKGQYTNNVRNGLWLVYKEDGKPEFEMNYKMGRLDDPSFAQRENNFLDMLEKNKGKIADPEITGIIWN
ncbi:MAG: hypothetical protein FJY11_06060 [Bacteroidetes bacterium]|nr:hypothetical protein [Bacteroidota bacterium]